MIDVLTYNGKLYKSVPTHDNHCRGCAFYEAASQGDDDGCNHAPICRNKIFTETIPVEVLSDVDNEIDVSKLSDEDLKRYYTIMRNGELDALREMHLRRI